MFQIVLLFGAWGVFNSPGQCENPGGWVVWLHLVQRVGDCEGAGGRGFLARTLGQPSAHALRPPEGQAMWVLQKADAEME